MLRFVFLVFLCTGLAVAQEGTPPASAPARTGASSPSEKTSSVAVPSATTPVITIKGVCKTAGPSLNSPASGAKATTADCKTVVTRSEFEELVNVLQVPPPAKKQFATQYATALIMANEAHKRGLDHGPRYDAFLKLARLQVLTRQLAQTLQEEAGKVSDQEIENYYKNNTAAYDEANLSRLYIPRTQQQDPPKAGTNDADTKKKQDDSAAAMKKEADDLRARAAAGEDFPKLQAEAYKFANFKAAAPDVKMEKARRSKLPPSQSAVFDLKPGDVSPVFADPSGYFVYKLEQKSTVALDSVKEEIKTTLQKQHMQDASQTMQQSATPTFDDSYFADSAPPIPTRRPAPGDESRPPATQPATGPK